MPDETFVFAARGADGELVSIGAQGRDERDARKRAEAVGWHVEGRVSGKASRPAVAPEPKRPEPPVHPPAREPTDRELLGQVLIELRQIRETLVSKRRGPIDKRVARAVAVGVVVGVLALLVFLFVVGLVIGALGLGVSSTP